jgi:hypothetical protein
MVTEKGSMPTTSGNLSIREFLETLDDKIDYMRLAVGRIRTKEDPLEICEK